MNRRRYLHSLVGAAGTLTLAGCAGRLPGASDTPATGSSSPSPTPTGTPTDSPTPDASDPTLRAGGHAVALSNPRLRASVRRAGTHLDVHAEPDTGFLVLDATPERTQLDDLSLSLVADGSTVAGGFSHVGWPDDDPGGTVAFGVPVASYGSAAVVLDAGGETDRWRVPDGVVAAFGTAPDFRVESLVVPASVDEGDSFEATFTVRNEGDRDARFLAEFGHAQISDTGEVTVGVPAGESRTHARRIDPYYESDPETVPVVLDWGLDRRRVEVAVRRQATTTAGATATRSK